MGKGYVLRQPLKVEALGAVFCFHPPDRALARFFAITAELRAEAARPLQAELGRPLTEADAGLLQERVGDAAAPPEVLDAMVDLFLEGVHAWSGVADEAGNDVPCNRETKLQFPTEDKLAVAQAFLEAWEAVAEKKASPEPTPTTTSPDL